MYQKILEDLSRQINTGALPASSKIPSETDLAKRYGVSRMTVRQALDRLETDGLVVRQQGLGNFVSSVSHRGRHLNRLGSFSDELLESPDSVTSVIVEKELTVPPEEVAQKLETAAGQEATRILRVRLINGSPAAVQDSWIPFSVAPGLAAETLIEGSLYRTLRERYGIELRWADQAMTAVVLNDRLSGLLGTAQGAPALAGERVTHSSKNQVVELTKSWTLPEFPLLIRIDA